MSVKLVVIVDNSFQALSKYKRFNATHIEISCLIEGVKFNSCKQIPINVNKLQPTDNS